MRLATRWPFSVLATALILLGIGAGNAAELKPGQSPPARFYAIGDSIMRAFDANLPYDNLPQSWATGYHEFWQRLFGLPDVKSHNQRISANFGGGRSNTLAARNGARMDDFASLAAGAAGRNVTYATVMLGGNDVCRDNFADIPTDAEFEANAIAGMNTLLANLRSGATVYVAAIPDIKRLYDVGKTKQVLGIVDCPRLWALTAQGFPCGTMLSPNNTEADRAYVRSRNIAFNRILKRVTAVKAAEHRDKFLYFTDITFTYPFQQDIISDLDCYHPSWQGQRLISQGLWEVGPFKDFQKGN